MTGSAQKAKLTAKPVAVANSSAKSNDALERQLNEMATALVLLDATDMPALGSLHDLFLALRDALTNQKSPLAAVTKKCADLIEKIIFRDVPDANAAITSLNEAVVGLQAVIRDQRELSVVRFPEDLKPEGYLETKISTVEELPVKNVQPILESPKTVSAPAPSNLPTPPANPQPPAKPEKVEMGKLTMQFQGADTSLVAEFINEAKDHCLTAEQKMMDLETGADYDATINAIFRSFHTIKGAAGFLELFPIGALAHESETLLDLVRKGTMSIAGRTADIIFASIDGLRKLLVAAEDGLKSGGVVDGTAIVTKLVEELRYIKPNIFELQIQINMPIFVK